MNKIHNNLTIENLIKTEDFKQLTIKERKELITSSQWFNQFDKKQQEEILDGTCYNLDISIYAKSEFDHYQMDEIKRGLKKGLDVSIYAKTEFNWKQMKAILFCLKENLKLKLSSNENEILILK